MVSFADSSGPFVGKTAGARGLLPPADPLPSRPGRWSPPWTDARARRRREIRKYPLLLRDWLDRSPGRERAGAVRRHPPPPPPPLAAGARDTCRDSFAWLRYFAAPRGRGKGDRLLGWDTFRAAYVAGRGDRLLGWDGSRRSTEIVCLVQHTSAAYRLMHWQRQRWTAPGHEMDFFLLRGCFRVIGRTGCSMFLRIGRCARRMRDPQRIDGWIDPLTTMSFPEHVDSAPAMVRLPFSGSRASHAYTWISPGNPYCGDAG